MPAKHFGYYDNWKHEQLTCPKCGWTGTFEEGIVEPYSELMDSSCPHCEGPDNPMLAIVRYPTMEETEAHWDKLTDEEKQQHPKRRERFARLDAERLRNAAQLCDLEGDSLAIEWDFVTNDEGENRTVIRFRDKIVWDEPAVWEGYDRFSEVATILASKYGGRFIDLAPTDASWMYLLGDSLTASQRINETRRRIRGEGG